MPLSTAIFICSTSAGELFVGGATGPKRFAVYDPNTRLINAYVRCTTGLVDLEKFVGAVVGVVGKPHYDEKLRMYVIEAEQVVVLEAAPPAPPVP